MLATATLGFPRIGDRRQLKQALEAHWSGRLDQQGLERAAAALRAARWNRQRHLGVALVPSNDFSLYDHVLDACCLVGAVPTRFGHAGGPVPLSTYFRMARGGQGCPALEMTKWFDTNYHYLVPELDGGTRFAADPAKPLAELREAAAQGTPTRPVLVGPLTFLRLAKRGDGGDRLDLLDGLTEAYARVLAALHAAGATWIQLDEPILATDLEPAWQEAFTRCYARLAATGPRLMLATYFGPITHHLGLIAGLPVHGVHLDLRRGRDQLAPALTALPGDRVLSLGVVDGRNLWRTDLDDAIALVRQAVAARGAAAVQVAASCSLLHAPVDLSLERTLPADIRSTMAFASEKCSELALIATAAGGGSFHILNQLQESRAARAAHGSSAGRLVPAVRTRAAGVTAADLRRGQPFAGRRDAQHRRLSLPAFPTTTIGSFPQTPELRTLRAEWKAGTVDDAGYRQRLEEATDRCIAWQEEIGLDVLVHGEFERTDMVEHFGERLSGFLVTENGWVQSYGSRCVKPPVIHGDVSRPAPMTVEWARYAQSRTTRWVKGMLTGPVTILQWSFVRDDLPRSEVARQIALALRDEIADLEQAGIAIIQVDEPALREGLPLRAGDHADYLRWAVDAFRLATAGVGDDTQIHTHMCYSEFNDIIAAIAELDSDVISIETSRSRMELLDAFERFRWPSEIGPGVYDIHSPAVPSVEDMVALLRRACRVLDPERLWVNPDCGLKTRGWAEVEPALRRLVEAARAMRASMPRADAAAG